MDIKLTISDIIPNTYVPNSTYVLHITHGHGDDVLPCVVPHKFEKQHTDTLTKTIQFCMAMMNVDMGNARFVSQTANNIATELEFACTGSSLLVELLQYDKYYPGMFASIVGLTLL